MTKYNLASFLDLLVMLLLFLVYDPSSLSSSLFVSCIPEPQASLLHLVNLAYHLVNTGGSAHKKTSLKLLSAVIRLKLCTHTRLLKL